MPIPVQDRLKTPQTYAASGSINLEISPVPFTITELLILWDGDFTTTTATWFNDPFDRIFANLSLDGNGKTYFSFTDLRIPYHLSRYEGTAYPKPSVVADSQTNLKVALGWRVHFGIVPYKLDRYGRWYYDPYDLTAGIPPTDSGNLTLSGAFGAAAAMGTNTTINTASKFQVYAFGVRPAPGDAQSAYWPKAIPKWQMSSPAITATSSAFGQTENVPGGDFLHSVLFGTYRGTNNPRNGATLNSFQVWNDLDARTIFKYGGQSSTVTEYKPAEIISQALAPIVPRGAEDGINGGTAVAPGVMSVTGNQDVGLVYIPFWLQANAAQNPYGADLRAATTGNLQLQFGVDNATSVTCRILYKKYQLL